MFKKHLKPILIILVFLTIAPFPVFAQSSSLTLEIVDTLSVIPGIFIETPQKNAIINKGYTNKVKKGDIWTIFSKGEKIIDPTTGKALGSLPIPVALCRVTDAEASFSEVSIKNLQNKNNKKPYKVKSGQTALRFKDVNTIFMDVGGKNYSLYKSIRAELPSLNWEGYKKIDRRPETFSMPYGVVILAENNQITIWSGGEILLSKSLIYANKSASPMSSSTGTTNNTSLNSTSKPNANIQASAAPVIGTSSSAAIAKATAPSVAKPSLPAPSSQVQAKGKTASPLNLLTPGLASNIKINNYRSAGTIDKIVLNMGIMKCDNNASPFFVYLSGQTIFADSIDGKEHYKYKYDGFGEILNMVIGKDNLIVLNIFVKDNDDMESRILSFKNGRFEIVAQDINYILSMMDTNGDGINDSIYGQEFDSENFLGTNTYLLSLESGSIVRVKKIPSLPSFNIMGAFICDLNHNGIKDIGFYNAGRKFVIYENNKEIWESSTLLCGSVKNILYDDPLSEFDAPKQISIWSMPAIIQSNGKYFVAVPANQSGLLSVVGGGPEKGGLAILSRHKNNYMLRKIDSQFQGAIQSVFTYGNELYLSVVEGNLFTEEGRTDILALPLKDITGK